MSPPIARISPSAAYRPMPLPSGASRRVSGESAELLERLLSGGFVHPGAEIAPGDDQPVGHGRHSHRALRSVGWIREERSSESILRIPCLH
jgi:hypothetical protein